MSRSIPSSTTCRRRRIHFHVDLARAREGKAIFKDRCASCHKPRNETIYQGL